MSAALGGSAAHTDAGRRRRRNEDAYVHLPPLFAVCDGMGGALAGELASRLAASALEQAAHRAEASGKGIADGLDLVAAIREGNRAIKQRSETDPATAGMGTTVTAALVGADGAIRLGHVGDSRAYRLRGDVLEQLTPDHSLVAELLRTGQISPEEAESHPQRAVITRALGTDSQVEVDVLDVQAEPGDVYLLCSDGLIVMIDDAEVQAVLARERGDLGRAARALVAAANAAGGEDNITCVLFETVAALASPAAGEPAADDPGAESTAVEPHADEDTLDGLDVASEPTMVLPAPQTETGWDEGESGAGGEPARLDDTVVVSALGSAGSEGAPADAPGPGAPAGAPPGPLPPPRRRRRGRKLTVLVAVLALLGAAIAAGVVLLSRAHFVGADSRGRLVVYQGVPWDISRHVRLYRAVYVSPVLAFELSQQERLRLFDHGLHSKKIALDAVKAYERELLR